MGLVAQKQTYIIGKMVASGKSESEANTLFLEALNIASNGELLKTALGED
jgi:hypothetical protein